MVRKLLVASLAFLFCFSMTGNVLVLVFRAELANWALGLRRSSEGWAQSREVQDLLQVAAALREPAHSTAESKLSAQVVEDALRQFPTEQLQAALVQMRPSTGAYVLARIPDETQQKAILSGLPPEVVADLQEWMILWKEQGQLEQEKRALTRQEKRMELFQTSLDQQRKLLVEMQESLRKDFQELQQLQLELEARFVAVGDSEKSNLARLARIYSEMEPQAVARILETKQMQEERFILVLSMMEAESAAAVLEALEPGLSARLSARLSMVQPAALGGAERRSGASRARPPGETAPAAEARSPRLP